MRPSFVRRHVGPDETEQQAMLGALKLSSLEALMEEVVPPDIRVEGILADLPGEDEYGVLEQLKKLGRRNTRVRYLLGGGYQQAVLPAVLQRQVLENPGWYTAYTPYQAEISQGRLEALLTFQTLVCELTGMEVANASMLDEATAAAEAAALCWSARKRPEKAVVLVSTGCHAQTRHVIRTRMEALGLVVEDGDHRAAGDYDHLCAVVAQYPATDGSVETDHSWVEAAHAAGAGVVVAADPLALALLEPPGRWGADVVVGSLQRFGLPMGCGGPHAAFLAVRDADKRLLPGRLIGVSRDAQGRAALRLALQTREQHIRRDKATSNICTAQVLPAVIAAFYAMHHGPEGLRAIAGRIHGHALRLAAGLRAGGWTVEHDLFFDTLTVRAGEWGEGARHQAAEEGLLLRDLEGGGVRIALDECTTDAEVRTLLLAFGSPWPETVEPPQGLPLRTDDCLHHPLFRRFRSETDLMRYIKSLEEKDVNLTRSMIPLGSCTMKLNAAAEMLPLSWEYFGNVHPHAPEECAAGYRELARQLKGWLAELTGFAAVSLQPNAGSQGEYAGLLCIRNYQSAQGQGHRDVCLIPQSAHGTNFATAAMAGYQVVVVGCDERGNIDLDDLTAKAAGHAERLACCMVTYPSTHGVFEERIRDICAAVHENGGQVYMDGANMNAQVGWTSPAAIGADVCHLNLHKTFCIPHGGGGPGVGPICVAEHLAPHLPADPEEAPAEGRAGPVAAAALGSGSILTIPWVYLSLMGGAGLREASAVAILNANYVAERLRPFFPVLYTGGRGRVAHECILDLRGWKAHGIEVEDVAKRLIDYGFHAPTMSWPVPGTLMVEPTESESKGELDRFCEAMTAIHGECCRVRDGKWPRDNNPLKHAPHPAEAVLCGEWDRPYTREQAVFPLPWVKERKYWPPVARVDNVYGDRNLFCTCPAV